MLGVIERIKNSVLLKCNTLNDNLITNDLTSIIDTVIYHFAEEMVNIIGDLNLNVSEKKIRNDTYELIGTLIIKKIKRKLFIDSLALQITNDSFIESYVNNKISLEKLSNNYLKELNQNKKSNQLNMTEDLKMDEIMNRVKEYVDKNIIILVSENEFFVSAVNNLVKKAKKEFEDNLEKMIHDTDLKYLDILINELKEELNKEKGEDMMMESVNIQDEPIIVTEEKSNIESSKFDKYDDMTLFNKVILSLNTKEEKLLRNEDKLKRRKQEVDESLSATNKNIEANIERENRLSRRKLDLNSKEIELNSKLSEAEVIFLNMKPLIKGLNKISVSDEKGGNDSE